MITSPEPSQGSTAPVKRRQVEPGPTAIRVAENLRRLRERRKLSVRALSELLSEAGHPIFSSGLTNIERGKRAVDVDDLVALAAVLGCTPNALLLTLAADDRPVALTRERVYSARTVWRWGRGVEHIDQGGAAGWHVPADIDPAARQAFHDDQRSEWNRENRPDDPEPGRDEVAAAMHDHRDLIDAQAATDAAWEAAEVPIPVRTYLLELDRNRRFMDHWAHGDVAQKDGRLVLDLHPGETK